MPGEGVAEHGLQTEPLGPPRPRGLLLLQLLDALRRERETVLFNDALNTFYLQLYGERERNGFI